MDPDKLQSIARLADVADRVPTRARLGRVELVVVRFGSELSVFHGLCPHQGTPLVTGSMAGTTLRCPSHEWCFDARTGERVDRPGACLHRFEARTRDGEVLVDACEVGQFGERSGRSSPHAPSGRGDVRAIADLPGPRRLPLLGNLLSVRPKQLHRTLEEWAVAHGETYAVHLPPIGTAVVVTDPQTVRGLLKDRPDAFRRVRGLEPMLQEVGGHGLFSQEGEQWRRNRRLTMPSFNMGQLRSFHGTMTQILGRLQRRWREAAAVGRALHVQDEMSRFTVDITTALAFGHDLNTIEDKAGDIRDHLAVMLPRISERLLSPVPYWRYIRLPRDRALDRALGVVRSFMQELLRTARAAMKGKRAADATSFLESLAVATDDSGERLTDDEILGNVLTMLVAGEDTTAHSLAWIVHFMTEYPEIQVRMRDEANAVLGGGLADEVAAYDRLPFINAVASEAMRLRPVAPMIFLEARTDVEFENIFVPAGTPLFVLHAHAGRRERNFANATRFDPDRWLAKDGRAHHPEVLFPFGFGPRHCPGRSLAMIEIISVLAMLSADFVVDKTEGHPPVSERFGFVTVPTAMHMRLRSSDSRSAARDRG